MSNIQSINAERVSIEKCYVYHNLMIHSLSKDKALLQIFFWFCLAHGCLHASCLLNLSGHMHACALIDGGENLLASSAQKKSQCNSFILNGYPISVSPTHHCWQASFRSNVFRGYGDTRTQRSQASVATNQRWISSQ